MDCTLGIRVQEPCESRGGRPGLVSLLNKPTVSVDVKQHSSKQATNLGQDILPSELSHDEAVLVRALLVASVNDEAVVLGLDVDLLRLEVLDIHVDTELFVSVHHLKKKQQQLVLSPCSFSNR